MIRSPLRPGILLVLAAVLAPATASPSPAAIRWIGTVEESGAVDIRLARCENGLTVVADARPGTRTVFARIAVRAGSRDDPPRKAGMSHLLEHLLFEEGHAPGGAGNPAFSALRAAGALVNATTDFEVTEYHADLPADRLVEGWSALAALVGRAEFDEEDVDRERRVVLQEVALGKTDPLAIVAYSVLRRLFPGDPLGSPIIGLRRTLRAIGKEDLEDHFRRHYRPGNMFATIVGDADPERAVGIACGSLQALPPGDGAGDARRAPAPDVRPLYRFRTLTRQSYLLIGALTAGDLSPDAPALELLATILGDGRTSRLHARLVDREAFADDVLGVSFQVTDTGAFGAGVAVLPDHVAPARAALAEEMARLAREPVSEAEIATARKLLEGRLALQFETNEGIASFRARRLFLGQAVSRDDRLASLSRLTPGDLLRAARSHWGEGSPGPTAIEVLPARGFGKVVALLKFVFFRRL